MRSCQLSLLSKRTAALQQGCGLTGIVKHFNSVGLKADTQFVSVNLPKGRSTRDDKTGTQRMVMCSWTPRPVPLGSEAVQNASLRSGCSAENNRWFTASCRADGLIDPHHYRHERCLPVKCVSWEGNEWYDDSVMGQFPGIQGLKMGLPGKK